MLPLGDKMRQMTQLEMRREIVINALRRANNMVVEVLSNHGPAIPDDAREKIREITRASEEAQSILRQ